MGLIISSYKQILVIGLALTVAGISEGMLQAITAKLPGHGSMRAICVPEVYQTLATPAAATWAPCLPNHECTATCREAGLDLLSLDTIHE